MTILHCAQKFLSWPLKVTVSKAVMKFSQAVVYVLHGSIILSI